MDQERHESSNGYRDLRHFEISFREGELTTYADWPVCFPMNGSYDITGIHDVPVYPVDG